ncbi:MAG: hypothetical protein IIB56_07685 [Planctomycetes bacterium]|nr:hypothetical protein [Planctomycetota bacterium]MCH8119931.1 hypothetical protein [Planctomycetota bacterium]
MKTPENDKWLDDALAETIGSKKPQTGFEQWKQKHPEAIQMLTSRARSKALTTKRPLSIRNIIMKSPITKLAAAATIIIAVIIGINQFGGSIESVAFADVMQNIQNAQTLTYRSVITPVDQEPQVSKTMVLEPHLMRVELPNGRVWILDHSQGKALLLDSKNKQAVMSSTPQKTLGLYDTFRDFRNNPDFSVSRIGRSTIDGMQAVGFQLTRENDENVIIVWANPQTSLPIRIERTVKDKDGQVIKSVTTNIIFDAELDQSLFRLIPPEGYTHRFVDGPHERTVKLTKRMNSAKNMQKILLACMVYAKDHEDQWPDSLQDLTQRRLARDTLINPRQPEREIGYVYVKPRTPLSPSQIVLYEKYDSWGDGINVGYVDAHVQFIKKESNFKNDIQKPIEAR